jgi:excinuclease ABC subunit B
VAQLESKMHQHARDLEFEQAARLRDEVNELRQRSIGLSPRPTEPA